MFDRRQLLTGIGALLCAPAIVRASSLMPVKAFVGDGVALFSMAHPIGIEKVYDIQTDGIEALMHCKDENGHWFVRRTPHAEIPVVKLLVHQGSQCVWYAGPGLPIICAASDPKDRIYLRTDRTA